MKLLVLTAAYPSPAEPQRAIFIENLNRALVRASGGELSVRVVAPRVHASDPREETRLGVEVKRFRYPSGGRRLKEHGGVPWVRLAAYLVAEARRAIREGRRGDARLVLCHWVLPTGIAGALAARVLRRPLVVFAHGSDLNRYGRRTLGRMAAGWCLRRAARIFAVSAELAERARSLRGVEEERVRVLPMGVSRDFTPGDRRAERERLGLGEGLELLTVGDLVEEKGILHLLSALEALQREGLRPRLHLMGTGPLGRRLSGEGEPIEPGRRLVEEGAVVLHGSLGPDELARWYRAADLLVHPSLCEGTPLSVLEALSCGLPVLASRVGGIPEVVAEGRAGRLVPPGDSGALAAALRDMLERKESIDELRRFLREQPVHRGVDRCAELLYPQLQEVAGSGT